MKHYILQWPALFLTIEYNPIFLTGDVLGFENLVYTVFEFVHSLIESSKFRSTVKKTVDQILYYVIVYMQMTEDQVSNTLRHNYCFVLFFRFYSPCITIIILVFVYVCLLVMFPFDTTILLSTSK